MIETMNDFYQWEDASRDAIDVKRTYIDMAGDLVAGLLLSQIIFWHLPGQGESKLRVWHEGELWLAKTRADWWDECRITPKQYDRAIKILRDKGLVKTAVFKFSGNPTNHIQIDEMGFMERIITIFTKGEERYLPKGKNDTYQRGRSSTEITTEITTETTKRTLRSNGFDQQLFADFWNAYPKKRGKGHAEKVFAKLKPSEELVQQMVESLEKQKVWRARAEGFVPEWKHPATWLNARCWEDEEDDHACNTAGGGKLPEKYTTETKRVLRGNEYGLNDGGLPFEPAYHKVIDTRPRPKVKVEE